MAKKKTTRKKKARTPASKSKSRRTASSTKSGKARTSKKKAKASKRPSTKKRGAVKAPKQTKTKAGKKASSTSRKSATVRTTTKKKAPDAAKAPRKGAAQSKPAASSKAGRAEKPVPAPTKQRAAATAERKPGMLDPMPTHPNDAVNARNTPARLTKKQLNHFRDLLLKRRAELIGDVQAMESGALRGGGSGDSGHAPMHMADAGSDTYDQEFALQLAATERELLEEIDKSLENIRDGTYGLCEVTGKPISLPRLEAKPWAKVCIEVARERDRFHRFRR